MSFTTPCARGGELWEERTKDSEFTLPILARHVRRSLLDRRCFRFGGGEGGRALWRSGCEKMKLREEKM